VDREMLFLSCTSYRVTIGIWKCGSKR